MDQDLFNSIVWMVFGLGFFIYVIRTVSKDDDRSYDRMLNERREFGYRKPVKKKWRFRSS